MERQPRENISPKQEKSPQTLATTEAEVITNALNFDFWSIDLGEYFESAVNSRWDYIEIKDGLIQEEWENVFIEINGTKFNKYKEWQSWYYYEIIMDEPNSKSILQLWYIQNWKSIVSIKIWEDWRPLSPYGIQNIYEINLTESNQPKWAKNIHLSSDSEKDIYEIDLTESHQPKWTEYIHPSSNSEKDLWNSLGEIPVRILKFSNDWPEFKPFKNGESWYMYKPIHTSPYHPWRVHLFANFNEKWEIEWTWVIVWHSEQKYFVKSCTKK